MPTPTDTNPPDPITKLNRVVGPEGKPVIWQSGLQFKYQAHLFALLSPISDALANLSLFADTYPDLATRFASLEANVAKAMDVHIEVADETARLALTTTLVQNGDFVSQISPAKLYLVADETKLGTADAFLEWNVVGPAGVGISSISQPSVDTQRFNLSDGSHYDVTLYRGAAGTTGATGAAGATGVGVTLISQPSADTQRFNLSDGSHYDVTLYRGVAGADGRDGAGLMRVSGVLQDFTTPGFPASAATISLTITNGTSPITGGNWSLGTGSVGYNSYPMSPTGWTQDSPTLDLNSAIAGALSITLTATSIGPNSTLVCDTSGLLMDDGQSLGFNIPWDGSIVVNFNDGANATSDSGGTQEVELIASAAGKKIKCVRASVNGAISNIVQLALKSSGAYTELGWLIPSATGGYPQTFVPATDDAEAAFNLGLTSGESLVARILGTVPIDSATAVVRVIAEQS